jgi:maltooligosyltrehalose trehalohydrolase
MMYQLDKRTLGITFTPDQQASVTVWAPLVKHLAIKIYGQPAAIPLKREELGHWCLTTDQVRPGDLYTYVLNGDRDYPDPVSICQPQGVHGPSQAVDLLNFPWTDDRWKNPALDEYLMYEIHTGTFTGEGTFSSLESKLDYLKKLGVNAIELMPVAQFSDSRNWGYDGVYTYAVQNSYGGARGLQHLVDTCHAKGIAVVLDVVYNHFGPEGNYLGEYGPYLTGKYCTPWGEAVNFDDAWCDGVRRYVVENALMWFRDFHIDALRLDAVHAIKDFGPVHILQTIRQEVDKLMELTGRSYYLIVENDLNDPRYIDPLAERGYGMDAQWTDEFHHALRVTAGEPKTGYYADFDSITHLAKAYMDAFVYDGQYSAERHKTFGRKAETNPGRQFVVFSQNHDQVGNRKGGERSSQLFSYDMLKLLAGAVLVSPYVPLLFMGEEWGETSPFYYFVSHTEPELIEAVRKGRQEEFASFQSEVEVADPESDETFEKTKVQWELIDAKPHQQLLRYYQTLIALRRQLPALSRLDRQQLAVYPYESQQALVLLRWHGSQQVSCLMNFSKVPQSIPLPDADSNWQKVFDSADADWLPLTGISSAPESVSGSDSIILQPESIVIYAHGYDKSSFYVPNPISRRLYLS